MLLGLGQFEVQQYNLHHEYFGCPSTPILQTQAELCKCLTLCCLGMLPLVVKLVLVRLHCGEQYAALSIC